MKRVVIILISTIVFNSFLFSQSKRLHITFDNNVGIFYNNLNQIKFRCDGGFIFSRKQLPTTGIFFRMGMAMYTFHPIIGDASAGLTYFINNKIYIQGRYLYLLSHDNYFLEPQISWNIPKYNLYLLLGYNLFLNNGECSKEVGGVTLSLSYLVPLYSGERIALSERNKRIQKRKKNNQ